MTYVHRTGPVILTGAPIDPDSTDWFYWTLGGVTDSEGAPAYPAWLLSGEAVTDVSVVVTNGAVLEGPTLYASRNEAHTGYTHATVYGVKVTPTIAGGAGHMSLTLRITTGAGRESIDKTISVPVIDR